LLSLGKLKSTLETEKNLFDLITKGKVCPFQVLKKIPVNIFAYLLTKTLGNRNFKVVFYK